jgi:hypothetical protein
MLVILPFMVYASARCDAALSATPSEAGKNTSGGILTPERKKKYSSCALLAVEHIARFAGRFVVCNPLIDNAISSN